jgi:hypothetical protein
VERVGADTHVETILAAELGQSLVGGDTGGLQSLRGQLYWQHSSDTGCDMRILADNVA